jgi:hypothetical protein
VGPRAGLGNMDKRMFLTLPGLELRPLCRPVRRQSLYRLRYPRSLSVCINKKQTPWLQSASELYQPSDRRLSAKLVPTLAGRGYRVVSATDPHSRNLGFLDPIYIYIYTFIYVYECMHIKCCMYVRLYRTYAFVYMDTYINYIPRRLLCSATIRHESRTSFPAFRRSAVNFCQTTRTLPARR